MARAKMTTMPDAKQILAKMEAHGLPKEEAIAAIKAVYVHGGLDARMKKLWSKNVKEARWAKRLYSSVKNVKVETLADRLRDSTLVDLVDSHKQLLSAARNFYLCLLSHHEKLELFEVMTLNEDHVDCIALETMLHDKGGLTRREVGALLCQFLGSGKTPVEPASGDNMATKGRQVQLRLKQKRKRTRQLPRRPKVS